MVERMIGKRELAEYFDLSVRTVETWRGEGCPGERGQGPCRGVGYLLSTVKKWLAANGRFPGARGKQGARAAARVRAYRKGQPEQEELSAEDLEKREEAKLAARQNLGLDTEYGIAERFNVTHDEVEQWVAEGLPVFPSFRAHDGSRIIDHRLVPEFLKARAGA